MKLQPNITSLDEVKAFLLSQEADRATAQTRSESTFTGLAGLSPPGPLGQWGHSQTRPFPESQESSSSELLGVNRVTPLDREEDRGQQEISYIGVKELFAEDRGQQEISYIGVKELFADPNEGLSEFEYRVGHILRVGRIQNLSRNPYMYVRITGSATNKYIKFCADSGTPAAFVPRSVAKRNKLEIFPPEPDEASHSSATVIGQTSMFIKCKTMKTTKKLRWSLEECGDG